MSRWRSNAPRWLRLHAKGAGALGELYAEMALGLGEVHDPATCDIGLSRLQRAINDSRRGVPSALRDALATIVRAYEVAKQPNNALVYQEEVVRLNRDSRVKTCWSTTTVTSCR